MSAENYGESHRNLVFFDIETQSSFDEVGGRHNIHKLMLSVAVTFSTLRGTYQSYLESEVEDLIKDLQTADLVIGFNIIKFDYIVLQTYTKVSLKQLKSFDILQDLHYRLGHRVSLDSLAQSTLGSRKSADGLQAIQWYREGKIDDLIKYCQKDVEITKEIYEFGKLNSYVMFYDKFAHSKRKVAVDWS